MRGRGKALGLENSFILVYFGVRRNALTHDFGMRQSALTHEKNKKWAASELSGARAALKIGVSQASDAGVRGKSERDFRHAGLFMV